MKHRLATFALVLVALGSIAAGASAVASGSKLPKCSAVKCRSLGCPADVLCASGTSVKTCADVCNGH
jgi:hypothetical protein